MSDVTPKTPGPRTESVADPWTQATEAYLTAAQLYADTVQVCWMAGTNAMMGSLQSGLGALADCSSPALQSEPKRKAYKPVRREGPQTRSWYRPPVENPFLSMMDDVMRPWRTLMPDHSGHPQNLSQADFFNPKGAAEVFAAYHSGSGFMMAQISFPDEKSVSVTMPAPWAFLSPR